MPINTKNVQGNILKPFGKKKYNNNILQYHKQGKSKADSIQKFVDAGRKGDRNLIFTTAWDLKRQERKTHFHPNDFMTVIQNLTAREIVLDYVSVDTSYTIGDIEHPTKYEGIVPIDVKVQALTTLTLEDPQSLGYLTLKRKLYLERIEEEFNKILKKK